jgi:hypothetical protein
MKKRSITTEEKKRPPNRYAQIIEHIFWSKYSEGSKGIDFTRAEFDDTAKLLGVVSPKNLGDILYSFKFRTSLPAKILKTAPAGKEWVILNVGRGKYRFELRTTITILPNKLLAVTKVPDSTPGLFARYALNDEQALLTKLRYNRLVDIFTGITCYTLQNHLRTTVPQVGQVETDELYVGIDKRGAHYIFPIQAKSRKDRIGAVQIEQDFALCRHKFVSLICRPLAAQFISDDVIAMFAFEVGENGLAISSEKHYRLVQPSDLTAEELEGYSNRAG